MPFDEDKRSVNNLDAENSLSKEEYEVKKKRLYDEKLDAENRLSNFTAESDEIEITLEQMLQVISQVFNLYMSS